MTDTNSLEHPEKATHPEQGDQMKPRPGVLDGYVDRTELARQFDIEPRTVGEWVKDGRLPYVKLGKRHFFRLADVQAWIAARIHVRNKPKNAARHSPK